MSEIVKPNFIIILVLLAGILISNCQYPDTSNEDARSGPDEYSITSVTSPAVSPVENKKMIRLDESLIRWRGTKLMGTGKHEGTLKFKEGYLLFQAGSLIGGKLVADMRSIYITDIPLDDPIPRKNLGEHLNSDFETALYPVAVLEIFEVHYSADKSIQITGDLTIREISRPIVIIASAGQDQTESQANFTFKRFEWNIGSNGSWLEKKLVDADISIEVKIKLSDSKI